MSIADDATYQIPTETDVPCDECEATNTVTVWDDIRTGRWEREAFTCRECDTHHPAVSGTSLDRGAASAFVSLFALGLLLVAAPLAHLFYAPGTLGHVYLILTGALLLAGLTLLAVLTWLHQKGIS